MYFIEILKKFIKNKKQNRQNVNNEGDKEYEKCEHVFVPIDSTKKVFACMNCGLVINKKPKNLNFFEENK